MTFTEETTDMATLNTAKVVFNPSTESYEFQVKGKAVNFAFIPEAIDVRGGIDKRDPSYLIKRAESPEDATEVGKAYLPNTSQPTVHFNVPFIVFPKSFFADERGQALGVAADPSYQDAYALIQGNNRFKGLQLLMQANTEAYQAAKAVGTPEAMAEYEASKVNFDDINFEILAADKASDPDYVQWLQVSVNDGVSTHTPQQLINRAVAYIQFLKDRHDDWTMNRIREVAAAAFGVSAKRIEQLQTAKNQFPDWLFAKMDEGHIPFDSAVKLVSRFNKQIKDKVPSIPSLSMFYNYCWGEAVEVADPSATDIKITQSLIDKCVVKLTKKADDIAEDNTDINDEGDDLTGEGEGNGSEGSTSGKSEKPDPYAGMTADEKREAITSKLTVITEHIFNLMTIPDLTEKSLNAVLKAADSFLDATTLTTGIKSEEKGKLITEAMEQAITQAKEAEKEAKKAEGKAKVATGENAPSEAVTADATEGNPFNLEAVAAQ